MYLRRPQEKLAGCCWLPRFADKARLYLNGGMPLLYRIAFGSRLGVDGYFLRHFKFSQRTFLKGIRQAADDDALERWFVTLPGVSRQSIDEWNLAAPNLGAAGHPGVFTRHVVKWLLYPKSIRQPVHSIFEAIEQDENTGAFAARNE